MNDMVVIDTPPSMVADAQVLAGKVDAVLFVVQPGVTHTEAARTSLEIFRRAGARVVGVVLNRIPRNRGYYYGGYKYYSPYVYNRGKGYSYGAGDAPLGQPLEASQPKDRGTTPTGSYLSRLLDESNEIPPTENPKN
jgi:Mrp family chromosome partitioning ATPase